MMEPTFIIEKLENNRGVFESLLKGKSRDEIFWKPSKDKWCLLEIVCHLYDEEREDFRTRVKTTIEHPGALPPSIDPVGWVTDRNYIDQHYDQMVSKFLEERTNSVVWLKSLSEPNWDNSFVHSSLGRLTAWQFLINWLAHDYLHFRQITRLQYQYLQQKSGNDLSYAGNW